MFDISYVFITKSASRENHVEVVELSLLLESYLRLLINHVSHRLVSHRSDSMFIKFL